MKCQACQWQTASHSLGSAGKAPFCPQLGPADHLGGVSTLVCLRGLVLSMHCDQLKGTVALWISGKVFKFVSLQADKYNLCCVRLPGFRGKGSVPPTAATQRNEPASVRDLKRKKPTPFEVRLAAVRPGRRQSYQDSQTLLVT